MEGSGSSAGSAGGARNAQPNNKLKDTQAKVDEVLGIMRVNVEKVLEREERLAELDVRADQLHMGAAAFEQQAMQLKRKMWWKNLKMMIIMGVIGGVLLLIIIVWIVSAFQSDEPSHPPSPAPATPRP